MATEVYNDEPTAVVREEVITRTPFSGSRKIYIEGIRHKDVRVPMREVRL